MKFLTPLLARAGQAEEARTHPVTLLLGDCLEVMPTLDPESVDAIVTDPPYGLEFMGKDWDRGLPGEHFWREALRVAKPGAHLLAFGGTRTHHRLICAIEDAGWEIRDCLMWLYGSGFPKSHTLAVAFDKQAGAIDHRGTAFRTAGAGERADIREANGKAGMTYSEPISDLARQWQGWGTALKPAWEPITLARKPLIGTVAANVAAHGTGALNIDATRIGTSQRPTYARHDHVRSGEFDVGAKYDGGTTTAGRWPANVVLDEEAGRLLDEQSGDTGGASRFFYCAKASRSEREAGLGGMPRVVRNITDGHGLGEINTSKASDGGIRENRPTANHHPTVKPLDLMRWLCRLVTPPGGLILDPFCGSGTTGCAAALEGFRFLGIEQNADYLTIAERRIAHAAYAVEPVKRKSGVPKSSPKKATIA